VTSERKIKANRANASSSTGPKTRYGRIRTRSPAQWNLQELSCGRRKAYCAWIVMSVAPARDWGWPFEISTRRVR